MRNAAGLPQGKHLWSVTPRGGGGYCTTIDIASDGAMVTQSDVFNSFVKPSGSASWRAMFRADTLPGGTYPPQNADTAYQDGSPIGGYATAIAPSNSQHVYGCYDGYWWHSSNQGTSWTKIGGPYTTFANTGDQRLWHSKSVVDPQNPLVAMLGTEEGKIVYVTDGATPNVLTVATGTTTGGFPTPHLVAVDPSSSVVGGIKQKWAYSIAGTGVYQSTTGPGGTYSLLAGSPTNPCCLIYDAGGNLWALQYSASQTATLNNIYKKTPAGSFAQLAAPTVNIAFFSLAVNPQNTSQIVVISEDGVFYKSENGGTSWVRWANYDNNVVTHPTAIGWMSIGRGLQGRFFPSKLMFHPTNNKLYCACGTGVMVSTPPASGIWNWSDDTLGIENLEDNHILWPPGGDPLYCSGDFGIFRIKNTTRWVNRNHIPGGAGDSSGWFADYATDDPSFIVFCCAFFNGDGNCHGYSTDRGDTWTKFTGTHPAGVVLPGGQIVAASKLDLYWKPENDKDPAESHNGGATWALSTFPGISHGLTETGWGFSYWNPHHVFCVDKTNGDVYAYNYGPTGHESQEGIYYRQFGTSSWVKQGGRPGGGGGEQGSGTGLMIAVPGRAGELLYKGNNGGRLWYSANKGVSFTAVANITNMVTFCCGKAAPGKAFPAVYINGTVSGVAGLFRSDDGMSTWLPLDRFPMGHLATIQTMAASLDTYGLLALGTSGGGGILGTYDCPLTLQ